MTDMEAELTAEFSQPLVYIEGPKSRTQLTLTPWEIRVLVRRTIAWHLKRIEGLGQLVGRMAVSGKTERSPAHNTTEQGSAFSPEKAGELAISGPGGNSRA